MGKTNNAYIIKDILSIILISMLGCCAIVFSSLYIDAFDNGFMCENSILVSAVATGIISILTVLTITFLRKSIQLIYKLFFLLVVAITLVSFGLYIFNKTGFLDKVESIEQFRAYIASFGNFTVIIFILVQFLQVVILPIPSVITVGAGVLLFGPTYGAIYSCVGIIIGSLLAFAFGRVFGIKLVRWLIGKANLDKGLKTIKGKDRVVLTFMFLFPFFPDDILCFVSGITSMSSKFFVVMIFLTRIITIFAASFSMNNNIIPYNTWWGILLWVLFFIVSIILSFVIIKKGDKIESFLTKKRCKKR